MAILKIKDWIENKKQFISAIVMANGIILDAIRIKDKQYFKSGYFYNLWSPNYDSSFRIYEFCEDMIHIKCELMFTKDESGQAYSQSKTIEINDIVYSEENECVLEIKVK